jgi:ribonuclease BN (tRNA processing enzyme)
MQLTVMGCYGPYPPAGGACSGYLIRDSGFKLLIDCGNGVLSRLQEHMELWQLSAVVLSHLHADHYSDLMIMRYGLEIAYEQGLRNEPLPLYTPAEPVAEFERLPYKNAYTVKALSCEDELLIGPFKISFRFGVHAVPSLAMRIETESGTLVYSGDTEYYNGLEEFAAGANLFLCEANYLEKDIAEGLQNHLSSAQAAQIAAAAGVDRLLLTHQHPERRIAASLDEAKKYYPSVKTAREGFTYDISGSSK